MITEFLFVGLALLLAGIVIPLIVAGTDRRLGRTVSLICTVAASAVLAIISTITLLSGGVVSWTVYQTG